MSNQLKQLADAIELHGQQREDLVQKFVADLKNSGIQNPQLGTKHMAVALTLSLTMRALLSTEMLDAFDDAVAMALQAVNAQKTPHTLISKIQRHTIGL